MIPGGNIVVRGLREAVDSVAGPGIRANNRLQMAERLIGVFTGSTRERFATEGFGRWAPLSRATLRRHGDHATLRLTGALERSLLGPGAMKVVRSGFRYGTPIYYARFHHKGAGVPRRTVVGLRRPDRADARDVIERYVAKGL